MSICKDCNQAFEITNEERKFFESKKDDNGNPLSLPKRCKLCRAKRRREKLSY